MTAFQFRPTLESFDERIVPDATPITTPTPDFANAAAINAAELTPEEIAENIRLIRRLHDRLTIEHEHLLELATEHLDRTRGLYGVSVTATLAHAQEQENLECIAALHGVGSVEHIRQLAVVHAALLEATRAEAAYLEALGTTTELAARAEDKNREIKACEENTKYWEDQLILVSSA